MVKRNLTKECWKCKILKPFYKFHREKRNSDKLTSYCAECRNKIAKKYSKTPSGIRTIKRYRASSAGKLAQRIGQIKYNKSEHGRKIITERARKYRKIESVKIRNSAATSVRDAIRQGKMPHISTRKCVQCNKQAINYHHKLGYAKKHWLDVIPVCIPCHIGIHRRPRPPIMLGV